MPRGRTIWIADAHRGEGRRFVVRADEKLTAFLELESVIRACGDCKPAPQPVLNNQENCAGQTSSIWQSAVTLRRVGRFLLCSLTTNRPLPLIRHGRTCSSIDF